MPRKKNKKWRGSKALQPKSNPTASTLPETTKQTPKIPAEIPTTVGPKISGSPSRQWIRLLSVGGLWSWGWNVIVACSVLLGICWGVLQFRQHISVDPYVSYDASDSFRQRFTITNDGPFAIHDFHYVCSIMRIQTDDPENDRTFNQTITVMLPPTYPNRSLEQKEKIGTDCDFILKLGQDLKSADVAIYVFYKLYPWPLEIRTLSHRFSSKRDASGRFVWDYGSSELGPFDQDSDSSDHRSLLLVPFIGNSALESNPPPAEATVETTKSLISLSRKFGRQVILGTMLPPNVYLLAPAVKRFWPSN